MKEKIAEGKTKIIYRLGNNKVEIESKDDITAGDGAKKNVIPNKGILANRITSNIFKLLNRCGVLTHFLEESSKRSFKAHECEMIPVEVVIRRKATGSYRKRNPDVTDGTVFDDLVSEFFSKNDSLHDPYVRILNNKWELHKADMPTGANSLITKIDPLCSDSEAKYIISQAKKTFLILEEAWRRQNDITLWDLKVEFGRYTKYKHIILLADDIENGSWRIKTKDGENLDKQVYRDGGKLEKVSSLYETVANLTDNFANLKIDL